MPDEATKSVLAEVEKQGSHTLSAIEKLADQTSKLLSSVSELASSLKYSFTTTSSSSKQATGMWPIMFGLSGIVFALMTPLYTMMAANSKVQGLHNARDGHTRMIALMSALTERQREIETRFGGVNDHLERITKRLDEDDGWQLEHIDTTARFEERVRAIERNSTSGK